MPDSAPPRPFIQSTTSMMNGATLTQARTSTTGEQYRRRMQKKTQDAAGRVPAPKYRHATPSAPWPWMDFGVDCCEVQPVSPIQSDSSAWEQYPQSLFKNWTSEQVCRCQMLTKCSSSEVSTTVHKLDVFSDGGFTKRAETLTVRTDSASLHACWHSLKKDPPSDMRVQVLFVNQMSSSVLKILGTRFNIEPFFFASSFNWIPSRYREDPKGPDDPNGPADHITVILPFIRILKSQARPITRTERFREPTSIDSQTRSIVEQPPLYTTDKQVIDTQAPLSLPDDTILHQDLLSLHMVRTPTASTIISLHFAPFGTSAERLQYLVKRTGDSVYWTNIFTRSKDPTFVLLTILWYALYAWDEAFEVLYRSINVLEHKALEFNAMEPTQELHKLQAHLLHYRQLLQEFQLSAEFVRGMPNPAMLEAERAESEKLLRDEANNLISEIERLERQRVMMFDRLQNVIQLTVAAVNLKDSKAMQGLSESCVQDSKSLKQISYLAILVLPAQFLANVFSMNVREINPGSHDNPIKEPLAYYIVSVIGLTLLTMWLAIAIQKDSPLHQENSDVLKRALWPFFCLYGVVFRTNIPSSRQPPPAPSAPHRPSGHQTHPPRGPPENTHNLV